MIELQARAQRSRWRATAWRVCTSCGRITYVRDCAIVGLFGACHADGCKLLGVYRLRAECTRVLRRKREGRTR